MARNANQKKEGMLSRMISVVGGGGDEEQQNERGGKAPEGGESATALLRSEHDEVRKLFREFNEASENARSSRKRIADEACQKLDVHAQIEEKIFYPACRGLQDEDARKMVGESLEEHLIVKRLISELAGLDASDETFESKFTVLKENVEHHADEEESDLFPVAEKEIGDERLEALGMQMAQLKQRLLSGRGGSSAARRGEGSSRSGGRSSSRRATGPSSGRTESTRGRSGRSGQTGRSGKSGSSDSRSSSSRSGARSGSGGSSGSSSRSRSGGASRSRSGGSSGSTQSRSRSSSGRGSRSSKRK